MYYTTIKININNKLYSYFILAVQNLMERRHRRDATYSRTTRYKGGTRSQRASFVPERTS